MYCEIDPKFVVVILSFIGKNDATITIAIRSFCEREIAQRKSNGKEKAKMMIL